MSTLELSENEVHEAINSLDTYSRVWMVQFSHFDLALSMWRFNECDWELKHRVEDLLYGMRAVFLPEAAALGRGASMGIWNEKINELAVCAYDMQQVIRHDWSWFTRPEGGDDRWFDAPFLHGSLPVPKIVCYRSDNGTPSMRISLALEPLRLLLDALLARDALIDLRLANMMSLYTRDGRVLAIARIAMSLYDESPHKDTYNSFANLKQTRSSLIERVASALDVNVNEGYLSLALERMDAGKPITFGKGAPNGKDDRQTILRL